MGFSLRNLVKGVAADINPFDHGASQATVNRPQAKPAPRPSPASTAPVQSNPLQVRQVQRPTFMPSVQPVQAPKPLNVGVVHPQPLHVGNAVITQSPAVHTQAPIKQQPHASIAHDLTHNPFTNFLGNPPKSIVQGVSSSPFANVLKVDAAGLTHNQKALDKAVPQLKSSLGIGTPKLAVSSKNKQGKIVPNPEFAKQAFNLSQGFGETAGAKGESPAPKPTSKLVISEPKATAPTTKLVSTNTAAGAASKPTEQLPSEVVPTKVPLEATDGSLVKDTPIVTKNSLTAKVKGQNLSPEAQKLVQGEGIVRNTKQLANEAAAKADGQSLDKTIQTAHEALAVEPGKIDDATVAHVQQAIERADAVGRTNDAVTLHDSLSEHLRKQGQTIQAASLLYRLSPRGLLYKGMRDIKTSGNTVTPELENKLRTATDAIKQAPDAEAKTLAQATFHKLVADNLKKSAANKILSIWKAGLLSGPLTHAGNFASNETFNALKNVSNPIASGVDRVLSLGTGKRTKVTTLRGTLSGTKQGFKEAKRTITTGIDARNIEGNKYEVHGELNFKNSVVQKVFGDTSNGVFRLMSAGDQPVYYRNLKQNLYDLGLVDGKNAGLKGKDLVDHAQKLVANPTRHIAEQAKEAAQRSVLAQDSKIASSISRIAQEHPVLQAVVPFVKVPTNFLSRTLDFSPAGLGKAGYKIYKDAKAGKPFDQRALSEAIGEGITGAGIIALGAHLANSNLLSGQYPSSDQKEVQRWKAEGIQPNSVKLGSKWINLNYLGPVGLLLGAGKDYHTAAAQGDNGAMQAIAGFGKGLEGQSFLTGFSGAANALNDPGRYGANFVHSQAASIVPAWLNAVGNATDPNQRQADSTSDSVKARIPGVRNSLPVKQDVYGNPLKQRTNPLDMTVDPLKPANDLSHKNPVVAEVNRLHNVDPNNTDLQVTPSPVSKTVKIGSQNIKLNSKQVHDLQNKVGQFTQTEWGKLINTPEYQAKDDAGKAAMLNDIRTKATEFAQRDFVTQNNLGTYSKNPSKGATVLGQGGNVTDALKKPKSTTPKTPKAPKIPKAAKVKTPKVKVSRAKGTKKAKSYNYAKALSIPKGANQTALRSLVSKSRIKGSSRSKNLSSTKYAIKKQKLNRKVYA